MKKGVYKLSNNYRPISLVCLFLRKHSKMVLYFKIQKLETIKLILSKGRGEGGE